MVQARTRPRDADSGLLFGIALLEQVAFSPLVFSVAFPCFLTVFSLARLAGLL